MIDYEKLLLEFKLKIEDRIIVMENFKSMNKGYENRYDEGFVNGLKVALSILNNKQE